MRFRRGMTVLDRQKYRRLVLAHEMDKARAKAALHGLTDKCKRAMTLTGTSHHAESGPLHASCQGESSPAANGCLCVCHDEHRGGVVSGEVIKPDQVDEPVRHLEE